MKKLELNTLTHHKISKLIFDKKKILKTELIYFDIPIDGCTCYFPLQYKHGYTMIKMIKAIENNKIYGWRYIDGIKYKVRPKSKT